MPFRGIDPGGRRLSRRHFLGKRKGLLSITKHVARIGKLREHDQASAFARRFVYSLQTVCEIGLLGADDGLHLNTGNRDLAFRSRHAWPILKTKNLRARPVRRTSGGSTAKCSAGSGRRSHHRERANSLCFGRKGEVQSAKAADQALCCLCRFASQPAYSLKTM